MSKDPIHLEARTEDGDRIYSPSAGRNREAIGRTLTPRLPREAKVLEIASGSGEHAVHMCGLRPDIIWQTSDPDPRSRASQDDWAKDRPDQILKSLNIDTTQERWTRDVGTYDVMFCANMIHIAPWEAALGMVKGAGEVLKPNGLFALYGPFQEGEDTAPSNLEFDANLKRRNASWGVRDLQSVKHIFADAGLTMQARIIMPKENRLLIFEKSL